jgi:hypothetical protein
MELPKIFWDDINKTINNNPLTGNQAFVSGAMGVSRGDNENITGR